ncbi:sn-glycerol-3-phosphate-binding periplasmic protein UgpB [Rhodopseudomonas palustris]|uniref:sn-glycerol-3-phosphate-binding periplasmic protein UgpB n=1 Tax=Rhodopseudomonas palustris (strain ATCC BAA-98 / CGA009) TaxID=258594 RepID=Q6N0H4_RHOPA|nr:sn-glycerol-3-phosphate ABC transporter substrate-binding protein UgpB [Rhodopseudomonas palustris]OPF95654.1 ABC transporter substrate-binding protein [Rhodopseudomonas palustris]QQM06366.1 sn-glycerol-3-phosphate-binding periplasmic protein UgpB [Rhodopseudomonas palustris]RJF68798.1 sn-glycerol-3-phosphate ABC transporter substrate-binding protein UgpB [Rhodopseudomonas palustris]WAB77677.1 sn-glycerol-3-phosphate ABC transporter substrate-binding protein UgpB [Rhodopseudomonas palustris]
MAGILGRLAQIATAVLVCATAGIAPAGAATEIAWWHAMSGELGRQLEKLAADFNASQSDYRVVPTYKGNYTQTVTAAIFAFRSSSQPAIVQVNEIATATMMAAKGAVYPVYELMRDESEVFSPADYLPAVTGYYTDLSGNMLSFPFNASTPILYYNKTLFRRAGLDPEVPPTTWPEVGTMAKRLIDAGAACGFTTSWPSWVHIENFSAYHNLPLATQSNGLGGLDAELVFNNPAVVRHIAQLADWQKTKTFDYGGRATAAEPRFQQGDCGIFIGSSATRADILANAKFDVGYGRLPYWPDIAGAPQNTIIGGATLWVLRGHSAGEYKGAAKFFAYLSKPEVQAAWHQHTGYLPITKAAYDLTRAQGFYDRNPGTAISIEQITLKPPTENSRGLRLGSFVLVRAAIEDEIEHAVRGDKPAKEAMDAAVERGNKLLRQFERTKP